mgnify:CR=1 FL=1
MNKLKDGHEYELYVLNIIKSKYKSCWYIFTWINALYILFFSFNMFIGWLLLLRHILKLTKEGHYQNDIDCFFKHKIHKQTHYRQQGGLEKRNKMTWTYIQHVPCVLLALAGRQHTAVAFAAEEGRADPRSVRLVDRGLELRIRQPTLVDDEKSFCLLLHCCCCLWVVVGERLLRKRKEKDKRKGILYI